jgi:hypothetical protein
MKKLTNVEFIDKANIIHSNKYSYDSVEYKSSSEKVIIICKEHGPFSQVANSHLRGIGCSECSGNHKSTSEEFIYKSNLIHKNKYDYSLVEYTGARNKVIIICKEHGPFEQTPNNHLNSHGCNKCGCLETNKKSKKSKEYFLEKSLSIHKDKYDYSLVEYIGAKNKVIIICKEHGEFIQSPSNHLSGQGCKKCSIKKTISYKTKTKSDFIKESMKIHGFKYDYSMIDYRGTDYKVKIICKEHGEFNQKPYKHLQNQGCPICKESKLEKEMRQILTKNKINFKQQYGGKSDDHYLNGQRLDFYLPDYNIAIECQGDQHFKPVDFGNKGLSHSEMMFEKTLHRDSNKYNLCKSMNINIFYFCKKYNYIEEYIGDMFHDENDIINKIKNTINGYK